MIMGMMMIMTILEIKVNMAKELKIKNSIKMMGMMIIEMIRGLLLILLGKVGLEEITNKI